MARAIRRMTGSIPAPHAAKAPAANVQISWRSVGIGATLVAVAAITSLVILASVKDVDALSAIALAMAIFAFVVQLLVFIAQTWTTSQINSDTRSLLEELRTRSAGTEQLLSGQVDKLTDHLMRGPSAAAAKKGDHSVSREAVRRDVEELITASQAFGADGFPPSFEPPELAASDSEAIDRLKTLPSKDEAAGLVARLNDLHPAAAAKLLRFAQDRRDSLPSGVFEGLPIDDAHSGPAVEELLERGLIEPFDRDAHRYARLTPEGREVSRLLIGRGPVPDWLAQMLQPS
jgi:hypothetical protein